MAKTLESASGSSDTPPSSTRSRSGLMWWGLAVLSLLLGFADLWRGGETIAPLLLILGYVVLIPIAILKR